MILLWAVELGRIDIFTEFTEMSQYSVSPRLGNIEGLYNMFEYMIDYDISRVVFDAFQPKVDNSAFASRMTDWKDFYEEIEEYLSTGM